MFKNIVDPKTGMKHKLNSKQGTEIMKRYLHNLNGNLFKQTGGNFETKINHQNLFKKQNFKNSLVNNYNNSLLTKYKNMNTNSYGGAEDTGEKKMLAICHSNIETSWKQSYIRILKDSFNIQNVFYNDPIENDTTKTNAIQTDYFNEETDEMDKYDIIILINCSPMKNTQTEYEEIFLKNLVKLLKNSGKLFINAGHDVLKNAIAKSSSFEKINHETETKYREGTSKIDTVTYKSDINEFGTVVVKYVQSPTMKWWYIPDETSDNYFISHLMENAFKKKTIGGDKNVNINLFDPNEKQLELKDVVKKLGATDLKNLLDKKKKEIEQIRERKLRAAEKYIKERKEEDRIKKEKAKEELEKKVKQAEKLLDEYKKKLEEEKDIKKKLKKEKEILDKKRKEKERKKLEKKQKEDAAYQSSDKKIYYWPPRLKKMIKKTFFAYKNKYYPFFMDELEKGWTKDKLEWVNDRMKSKKHGEDWFEIPRICYMYNEKEKYDFWFYLYGTIYDMGEAYKHMCINEPKKKYWRKMFINNYCKAHNDRMNFIKKKYIKTEGGKKKILYKKNNCKLWIDENKIKKTYEEGSISC